MSNEQDGIGRQDFNAIDELWDAFRSWRYSQPGFEYAQGYDGDGIDAHPILERYLVGDRWTDIPDPSGRRQELFSDFESLFKTREDRRAEKIRLYNLRYDKYLMRRSKDWHLMLQTSGPEKNPKPASNLRNVMVILRYHPSFTGVFRFNEFSNSIEISQRPPWTDDDLDFRPYLMTEVDFISLQMFLQELGLRSVSMNVVQDAALAAANDASYNPIVEYLDELTWDGVPRLDYWLIEHLGAVDNALNRAISAKFLIGAVARAKRPGCKVDTMLVLEGPQGIGKSQALGILGGDWFSDDVPGDITSKDTAMALQASWIIEQAEMHAIRQAEVNQLKNFLSRRVDKFRPPYGRTVQPFPRHCVCVGTMNTTASGYLNDETGARRFWPVLCAVDWTSDAKVDLNALAAERDQLFAEARIRLEQDEPWWLDSAELEQDQAAETDARYADDPWTEMVLEFLSDKGSILIAQIMEKALGLDVKDWTKGVEIRVGKILHKAGWERRRPYGKGPRPRLYYNPTMQQDAAEVVREIRPQASAKPVDMGLKELVGS
jgi:predicted P-loop ATPase